jgi:hypothetical protein
VQGVARLAGACRRYANLHGSAFFLSRWNKIDPQLRRSAMEKSITVKNDNLTGKTPVFFKYPRQFQAQPAFIELDCRRNGELSADYTGEIGNAVPVYLWNRLAVRWSIEPETTGESLERLFSDEKFLNICQTIVDGFEEKWNGSNFVGVYNEDAEAGIELAESIVEESLTHCEMFEVEEWLFANCSLNDHWESQPIVDAVSTLEACVEDSQAIDGDFETALIQKAKEIFGDDPGSLTEVHVAELLARGEITEEEAIEWRADHPGGAI